jgi:hypothetical protein
MRSPPHATTAVVVMVAGATAARQSPLHHNNHCRLRLCHTAVCWSDPRPLPPTGWRTDRWSPQTLTPLHGVAGASRAPSTVGGHAPTRLHRSTSLCQRVMGGGGGEEEEEDDERRITVVINLVGAPTICRMARISIDPRGRPQGLLVPRATTTPPTSPTPSLLAPPPPPGLSSLEAGPSGFVTPLDLLSLCGNRVLRRFTCFTTPSDKGRVPGSWDSTARPSH